MKKRIIFLVKLILVFALLYDINFTFLPSITTARMAFIALALVTIKPQFRFPKNLIYFLGVVLFVFVIALFQFSYSHDSSQCSRLLWFMIYGLITPVLFKEHVTNRNEFLLLIGLAVSLQALLSILAFINPAIKGLFYNLIIYTSNFGEDQTIRAAGFASIGGAGLSVIQSVGTIALLLLLRLNNWSLFKTILLWAGVVLVLCSTFIIGRTGLFISLFAIAAYIISNKLSIKTVFITCLIILMLSVINYQSILENLTSNVEGFNVELFTNWVGNAFTIKDNHTTADLNSMPVPPISLNTILGTGRVVAETGIGNASGNDSGYIQTYYSLGLVMAVLFYSSYLIFLSSLIRKQKRPALYILVFILFLIEIKEPFIFQYMFPFFTLGLILLINKTADQSQTKLLIAQG